MDRSIDGAGVCFGVKNISFVSARAYVGACLVLVAFVQLHCVWVYGVSVVYVFVCVNILMRWCVKIYKSDSFDQLMDMKINIDS
jgi:hypothetical protein